MNKSLKKIIVFSLLATILSVTAPLSINIGLVPITLATFSIYLIGGITNRWDGLFVVLLYLVLGIIGLPIFANFRGGIGVILGPTGGFIIGYLPIVLLINLFKKLSKNRLIGSYLGMLIGTVVCYAIGTVWFMVNTKMGLLKALSMCVAPFVLLDLVKILFAGFLAYEINKIEKVKEVLK